jgi:hypothetical protein
LLVILISLSIRSFTLPCLTQKQAFTSQVTSLSEEFLIAMASDQTPVSLAAGGPPSEAVKKGSNITREDLRSSSGPAKQLEDQFKAMESIGEDHLLSDQEQDSDRGQGDTLEDVEEQTEGMTVAFVPFSRQYAEYKEAVMSKINEAMEGCEELDSKCEWIADYDRPIPGSPNLMRIYVAFLREQDCRSFLNSEDHQGASHWI